MINTLIRRGSRSRLSPMADLAQRATTEAAVLDAGGFQCSQNRFNEAKILAMNKYDAATLWLAPGAYKAGSILPFLPKAGLTVPFTRNSAAWRRNSAGAFVQEAIDMALIHYRQGETCPVIPFEPSSINHIRNPIMQGAVVGAPGTLPNANSFMDNALNGLARQVVGVGVVDGINLIDIRLNGVANATGSIFYALETGNQISAVNGQNWTCSVYLALLSNALPSNNYTIGWVQRNSSQVWLGTQFRNPATVALSSELTRIAYNEQTNAATIAFLHPFVRFQTTSGQTYDFTIRIGWPQVEQFNYQTSPMPSNGSAAFTRAVSQLPVNALQAAGVFAANEGCVLLDLARMVANAVGTAPLVFRRADGTEVIRFEANGVANQYRVNLPTLSQASAYNAGTRIAVAWDGTNVRISQGGTLLSTFTGALGAVDQLRYTGNGLVEMREMLGYNAAPTTANLNALTA